MTKNTPVSCSLVIATYNWPEALKRCLESAFSQTHMPSEILVADDGSDERTSKVIAFMASAASVPIRHIWHPDQGFRLGEIRNKAIAAAKGAYIIQIDGDIMMDRHFIGDHLQMAQPGSFLCGSRVLLSQALSKRLMDSEKAEFSKADLPPGFVLNSLRIPYAARLLADVYKKNQPTILRGCNMSFWREDLLAVNGYNTDITGWGREDAELAIRLMNAGVKKRFLKFLAIAYHLYHLENSRDQISRNDGILNEAIEKGLTWAPNGIQTDRL